MKCNEKDFDFNGEDDEEKENAVQKCRFHTICGKNDPRCVVQQSMQQWKGKGYACRSQDKAGVACGSQEAIEEKLKNLLEIRCDR